VTENAFQTDSPFDNPDARYEGFVRLLMEHEVGVRANLRGLLPSWHDVEEVMQEASLVAWRKFSEFEAGSSFGGWLMTIARFEALKYRRKVARTPLIFSDHVWELLAAETSVEAEMNVVRQDALEVCLSKLAPAQRELVLKSHTPGVRMSDIAKLSGRSDQAFYKAMQRIRAALLECISKTVAREGST
jgi:RNA polymerase sigma-70 factor (ECF subfamily)